LFANDRSGQSFALAATAFSELLRPETAAVKWRFPQENATLHRSKQGHMYSGNAQAGMN